MERVNFRNLLEAVKPLFPKNKKEWLVATVLLTPYFAWLAAINLTTNDTLRIIETACGAPIAFFGSLAIGVLGSKWARR